MPELVKRAMKLGGSNRDREFFDQMRDYWLAGFSRTSLLNGLNLYEKEIFLS
jgi:hypothetical protein